jgi:hypothetical protein
MLGTGELFALACLLVTVIFHYRYKEAVFGP